MNTEVGQVHCSTCTCDWDVYTNHTGANGPYPGHKDFIEANSISLAKYKYFGSIDSHCPAAPTFAWIYCACELPLDQCQCEVVTYIRQSVCANNPAPGYATIHTFRAKFVEDIEPTVQAHSEIVDSAAVHQWMTYHTPNSQ
jgi:hypothetical protein